MNKNLSEIEARGDRIEAIEREIAGHSQDTQKSAAQIKQLALDLGHVRDEGLQIVAELRTLKVGLELLMCRPKISPA